MATLCPFHNPETGVSFFGVSLLSPSTLSSSSPHDSLLQLLGLSDQELQMHMVKGHPYAFNMGNNNNFLFEDHQEAGKVLMERNMPDVLHNRGTHGDGGKILILLSMLFMLFIQGGGVPSYP